MRAVKAKTLRKAAQMYVAANHKLYGEANVYQDKQHKPRKVESGKLNPDGTRHHYIITPVTRSLGQCQRKLYQDLKKV